MIIIRFWTRIMLSTELECTTLDGTAMTPHCSTHTFTQAGFNLPTLSGLSSACKSACGTSLALLDALKDDTNTGKVDSNKQTVDQSLKEIKRIAQVRFVLTHNHGGIFLNLNKKTAEKLN